jgi:hypothetical protein
MRKALLMALLVVVSGFVVSGSAAAKWVKVGEDDKSATYADPATISVRGTWVKMWRVTDFKTKKSGPSGSYASLKEQDEFNCGGEIYRTISYAHHARNIGQGNVVYINSNPGKWEPVSPGSVVEALWKIACGVQ